MRVTFTKDTKDLREGRTKSFKKGATRIVSSKEGKKYIDKGNAIDVAKKYLKKINKEEDGNNG